MPVWASCVSAGPTRPAKRIPSARGHPLGPHKGTSGGLSLDKRLRFQPLEHIPHRHPAYPELSHQLSLGRQAFPYRIDASINSCHEHRDHVLSLRYPSRYCRFARRLSPPRSLGGIIACQDGQGDLAGAVGREVVPALGRSKGRRADANALLALGQASQCG